MLLRKEKTKTRRLWQVMMQHHSDDVKSMFFLYPETRAALERLGWKSTIKMFPTQPVLGVAFGTDLTVWESGQAEPTLRIPFSQIESIELTHLNIDIWAYLAVCLKMPNLGLRRSELVLNLVEADGTTLNEGARRRLVEELSSKLARLESTSENSNSSGSSRSRSRSGLAAVDAVAQTVQGGADEVVLVDVAGTVGPFPVAAKDEPDGCVRSGRDGRVQGSDATP
ncbi:hypothetical protein [Mycetocola manganoxydans]|uniref:hypothetical protein n=1 Tax=Mycetocola manganoxydans TaxID=699879 RepID=UPI001E44B47A|nr:hypothetical protein [Mycetocola manganoxydans]